MEKRLGKEGKTSVGGRTVYKRKTVERELGKESRYQQLKGGEGSWIKKSAKRGGPRYGGKNRGKSGLASGNQGASKGGKSAR